MPRGRIPPLEVRLKALGDLTPLEPGEVTSQGRFRSNPAVVETFLSLDTRRRGEVVKAGLEALGFLEVEDGQKTR